MSPRPVRSTRQNDELLRFDRRDADLDDQSTCVERRLRVQLFVTAHEERLRLRRARERPTELQLPEEVREMEPHRRTELFVVALEDHPL